MKQIPSVFLYLFLSFLAAILVIVMIAFFPSSSGTVPYSQKFFVIVIFFACCIIGCSFAIKPGWIKKNFSSQHKKLISNKAPSSIGFNGHHPNCGKFNHHTFTFKKTYCAGCFGLALGAVLSLFLGSFYFLTTWGASVIFLLLEIGFLMLIISFSEILLPRRYAPIHVITNVILLLSFLCITIGVVEFTKNVLYGMLTIVLCFLWLDARIQLSQWQHTNICSTCNKTCKEYQQIF